MKRSRRVGLLLLAAHVGDQPMRHLICSTLLLVILLGRSNNLGVGH